MNLYIRNIKNIIIATRSNIKKITDKIIEKSINVCVLGSIKITNLKKYFLCIITCIILLFNNVYYCYAADYNGDGTYNWVDFIGDVFRPISYGGGLVCGSLYNATLNWLSEFNSSSQDDITSKFKYQSNNSGCSGVTFDNSGATYNKIYNYTTNNTTTNNYKQIIKNENNTSYVYNPITYNYETINNYKIDNTYNTYYFETNNYNYYVTNNYTYVTYVIQNVEEENDTTYLEMYYLLPDGRNSYNLSLDEIKGKYFIYDVINYVSVPEDDGITLGLYHFDSDFIDSSYYKNNDVLYNNMTFNTGVFNDSKYITDNDYLKINNSGISSIEFFYKPDIGYLYETGGSGFEYNFDYHNNGKYIQINNNLYEIDFEVLAKSWNHIVINIDTLTVFINGVKRNLILVDKDEVVSDCNFPIKNQSENDSEASASSKKWYNKVKYFEYESNMIVTKKDIAIPFLIINDNYIKFQTLENDFTETYNKYLTLDVEWTTYAINEGFGKNPYNSSNDCTHKLYETFNRKYNLSIEPFCIDELRLLSTSIYNDNFVVPSAPYDTNMVLVKPETTKENCIAIMSDIEVSKFRVGGVRSTLPIEGEVFIALDDNDNVIDTQQYYNGSWHSVNSAYYNSNQWNDLNGMSLDGVKIYDKNDSNGSVNDNDLDNNGGGSGDDSSGGGLSGLLSGLGSLGDALLAVIGKLLEYVGKAVELFTGTIEKVLDIIPKGFTELLTALFPFIPQEWTVAIELSLVLGVIVGIVGIFKK